MKFCENSQSTNILPQIWLKVQILFPPPRPGIFEEYISLNSSAVKMGAENYKSVFSIMDSKDHLKRNIAKATVVSTKSSVENSTNKHEMEMIVLVHTHSLWEHPRNYLSKHLGSSQWTLQDGSKVSFSKIHQKQ